MREIKFNAVDEETGDYIRFDDFVKSLKEENGFGYVEFRDDDTQNELFAKFLSYYFGYKLLQYTGLKDKNGVEIYEGDILKDTEDENNMFVWYNKIEARYVASYIFAINALNKNIIEYGRGLGTYEVIGNIYENKELLDD